VNAKSSICFLIQYHFCFHQTNWRQLKSGNCLDFAQTFASDMYQVFISCISFYFKTQEHATIHLSRTFWDNVLENPCLLKLLDQIERCGTFHFTWYQYYIHR